MSYKMEKECSFIYAFIRMKEGHKIKRSKWDTWLQFNEIQKKIYQYDSDDCVTKLYNPSQEDILSGDWEVWHG